MSFHQNRQGWERGPWAERAVVSTFRRDFVVDLLQVQR
jgi:hypothetical protein